MRALVKSSIVVVLVIAGLAGVLWATGVVRLGTWRGSDDGDDLLTLGYVGATPIRPEDMGKEGVTIHDEARASSGLNLIIPCGWGEEVRAIGVDEPYREARLVDMHGNVVHRWEHDYPGEGDRGWANAKFGQDGDLYVVRARTAFLRLGWDSSLRWGVKGRFHHDFDFLEDGTIVTLVEGLRAVEFDGRRIYVLDNGFAFISPDGRLLRTTWFYDVMQRHSLLKRRLKSKLIRYDRKFPKGGPLVDLSKEVALGHEDRLGGLDIFHANAVQVLPDALKGRWEAGDLMTTFRAMDTIAVFSAKTGKLRWHWGRGVLDDPHDPTLLENGNLQVFDNGRWRKWSRVLEVDPKRRRTVWTYQGTDDNPFFSDIRGQARHLDNGNVLIVSSQRGRAFEVDRDGKTLWEYFTPDVIRNYRIPFRMHRLQGEDLRRLPSSVRP